MQTRTQIRFFTSALLAAAACFGSGVAHAHFLLMMPPAADTDTVGGKGAPPCGPTSVSGIVTPAQGGHALSIALTENVYHPGHYRIALSINSRSELPPDPTAIVAANGNSVSAPVEDPVVFPVLADGIFNQPNATGANGMMFQTTVMLPNITCAKCTLQIIEFMAMHPLNTITLPDGTTGGTFYYHHCADLAITADPGLPLADGGTATGTGGGVGGRTGADAGADARDAGVSTGAGGSRVTGAGGTTTVTGAGGSTTTVTGAGGSTTTVTGAGGTTTVTGAGGSTTVTGTGGSTTVTGTGGSTTVTGAGGSGADGGPAPSNNMSGCGGCALGGSRPLAQGTGAALALLGVALALQRRRRR
jgi:hypothetical protein